MTTQLKAAYAVVVAIVVSATLASCSGESGRAATADSPAAMALPAPAVADSALIAAVATGKLTASRAVTAGWRVFRVNRTDNASHILVAFQVDPNLAAASFAATLDSLPGTPAGAVALGGPEGGATNEVVVRFPAGRVIVACVSRGDDGHRHATKGELAEIEVRPADVSSIGGAAPSDSGVVDVPMSDFAFIGTDRIPASTRFLRVRNRGQQDHQLRITRLKPGKTISEWTKDQDTAAESGSDFGMARLGSPHDAYLPVSLRPGTYVFYCLVTDPKSKMQHVELGMMRQIFVIP